MHWYFDVLQKYAQFTGRATRQEFWMFALINVIISVLIGMIDSILGLNSGTIGPLGGIYSLAVLVPSLAVGARRLHDIGRTGWMQLLALIPVVGVVILIVFWAQDTAPGDNIHGPNPKA